MSKMGKIKKTDNKRIIEEEYSEEFSFTNFISIILVILIVLGIFYTITVFVAKSPKAENNVRDSVIDSDMVTITNMLSKKESDYYVLAFKYESGKKTNLDIYQKYIKDIKSNNESFVMYKVNLSDAINKAYIGTENNITDDLTSFKISDEILLHVIDNKIEETFIGLDNISSKLKELKGE